MVRTTLAAVAALVSFSTPSYAEFDWKQVDGALGATGANLPGDVHRYAMPRSDLTVQVDGVTLKPALALGSWLAFKLSGDTAMVMGDLVLTEQEISPVMKRLVEGGIEITAVHNHILRASPATMYMHVMGHGDPMKLATTLKAALSLSKTPFQTAAAPPAAPSLDLDTAALDKIMRTKGRIAGGVYQFSVPRAGSIRESGMEVPASMGTATAINFQPTGQGKAAVAGDFVLLGSEVNPVLQVLRENGIEVTALHSHMLGDEPRLYFMHFWANDDAAKLARGLSAALENSAHKR